MKKEFYETDDKRFKMNFEIEKLDDILYYSFNLIKDSTDGYKLTPAYIFAMIIEYYSISKQQKYTRRLILSIAENFHIEALVSRKINN